MTAQNMTAQFSRLVQALQGKVAGLNQINGFKPPLLVK